MKSIVIVLIALTSFSSFAVVKQTLEARTAIISIDIGENGYFVKVDGVVTKPMNETVIEKIIELAGSKKYSDYKCEVKSVNFYEKNTNSSLDPKTALLLAIENCTEK
jgi:hypothetical protein